MNSTTRVPEEIFSKAASSIGSIIRNTTEKFVVQVYFENFWVSGLRDFLKSLSSLYSIYIMRYKQQPPGIVGITGEAPFWM